ncbi:MAG: glycoside hydrolase family 10 protein, partial [Limisphaerales bacterium]
MKAALSVLVWLISALLAIADEYEPAAGDPPAPPREFRGAWIATVGNKDWPSAPGLTVARQKAELISLLDTAARLKLNAVVFQVRPDCDAMYASAIEPWSEYLTGVQGRAPHPYYDPLAFAIEEAHQRGLELHAWFNPFRARGSVLSPPAPNFIGRTHPGWVRKYGDGLWLDPGNPDVRHYVIGVIMDVVRRYDVDGIQFDDYFYPYPVSSDRGTQIPFPDETTWRAFGERTGLSRENWRRQNIDQFIESVYRNIKAAKPWVKFGVSPFGIWQPGYPPQVRGFNPYAELYADSRLWLASGWVDYFSPQLYWPI